MLVMQHRSSSNWTTSNFLEARALNYTDLWEKGTIPMQLTYLTSHEYFDGYYGIKMVGAPGANTDDTLAFTNRLLAENVIDLPPLSNNRFLRILQTTSSSFLSNLNLPPTWRTSLPVETISIVVSSLVKFIVNILQIFLMFIRPFQL